MKLIISILLFILIPLTAHAEDCEKWKSEIFSSVINLNNYVQLCNDLKNNKITNEQFRDNSTDIIIKLIRLRNRVETVASCTNDIKFENRRVLLLNSLNITLPAMVAGEMFAPNIIEYLENQDQTNQIQAQAQNPNGQ